MIEGNTVELDKVLLIADGDNVTVGTPTVDGAKVIATSKGEGKSKKIIVFKYKPKVRYQKKTGHRQLYTSLAIDRIIEPGLTISLSVYLGAVPCVASNTATPSPTFAPGAMPNPPT